MATKILTCRCFIFNGVYKKENQEERERERERDREKETDRQNTSQNTVCRATHS